MDESEILALSIAQAVEADAALIEQFRQEDAMARDQMLAIALEENPDAIFEPVPDQLTLDEGTLNTLRLLNIASTNEDHVADADDGEEQYPGAGGAPDAQEAQNIRVTVDNRDSIEQDTVEDQHMVEGQQTIDNHPTPDEEATELQNAEILEDLPEGSTSIEQPVDDQQVEREQEEVQYQGQAHDRTEVVSAPLGTSAAPAEPSNGALISDTKQCASCQEEFPCTQVFEAPCSHYWCQTCLTRRIEGSMRNESLFPPTCCQPFPVEPGEFISQEMVVRFREKAIEFETIDRTYCSDVTCSAFILPQSIKGGIGRCPQCEKQTCALCKQASHEDVCAQDSIAQEVLRLGEAKLWKRCERCKHLIERNEGCFHIKCRCGHNFCYLCGEPWPGCSCFDEDFNRRFDAEAAERAANERELERQRQVEAEVQRQIDLQRQRQIDLQRQRQIDLHRQREAEERRRLEEARPSLHPDYCHHRNCDRVFGEHECGECRQTLIGFIFNCRRCDVNACARCLDVVRSWE